MGILTTSSLVLLELRSFDRSTLRATETVVTSPLGMKLVERLNIAEVCGISTFSLASVGG